MTVALRFLAAALLVVLAACGDTGSAGRAPADSVAAVPSSTPAASLGDATAGADATAADTASVVERAEAARQALAEQDFAALARLVHPERGLRFSPYAYVDTTEHVRFAREAVADLPADTTKRVWGAYDGTGDPIRLRFDAYYDEFVYDRDYGDARRGAPNERLGRGNTLENTGEAFGREATFVEYYTPGSEQYEGMDWSSLRLVFVPYEGTPHLVGVVHDQWTI